MAQQATSLGFDPEVDAIFNNALMQKSAATQPVAISNMQPSGVSIGTDPEVDDIFARRLATAKPRPAPQREALALPRPAHMPAVSNVMTDVTEVTGTPSFAMPKPAPASEPTPEITPAALPGVPMERIEAPAPKVEEGRLRTDPDFVIGQTVEEIGNKLSQGIAGTIDMGAGVVESLPTLIKTLEFAPGGLDRKVLNQVVKVMPESTRKKLDQSFRTEAVEMANKWREAVPEPFRVSSQESNELISDWTNWKPSKLKDLNHVNRMADAVAVMFLNNAPRTISAAHPAGAAVLIANVTGDFANGLRQSGVKDEAIVDKYTNMFGPTIGMIEYASERVLIGPFKQLAKTGLGKKVATKAVGKAAGLLQKKALISVLKGIGAIELAGLMEGAEEYSQTMLEGVATGLALTEYAQTLPEGPERDQVMKRIDALDIGTINKDAWKAALAGYVLGKTTFGGGKIASAITQQVAGAPKAAPTAEPPPIPTQPKSVADELISIEHELAKVNFIVDARKKAGRIVEKSYLDLQENLQRIQQQLQSQMQEEAAPIEPEPVPVEPAPEVEPPAPEAPVIEGRFQEEPPVADIPMIDDLGVFQGQLEGYEESETRLTKDINALGKQLKNTGITGRKRDRLKNDYDAKRQELRDLQAESERLFQEYRQDRLSEEPPVADIPEVAEEAVPEKPPEQMTQEEYEKTEPKGDGIRESFVAQIGPVDVRVVKNPMPEDYGVFNNEFDEQYPDAPKGEPKTRSTRDSEGNLYLWLSTDAMHGSMENWLGLNRNVKASQVTQFLSHKYVVYDAIRNKKPVNAKTAELLQKSVPDVLQGWTREGDLYVPPKEEPTPKGQVLSVEPSTDKFGGRGFSWQAVDAYGNKKGGTMPTRREAMREAIEWVYRKDYVESPEVKALREQSVKTTPAEEAAVAPEPTPEAVPFEVEDVVIQDNVDKIKQDWLEQLSQIPRNHTRKKAARLARFKKKLKSKDKAQAQAAKQFFADEQQMESDLEALRVKKAKEKELAKGRRPALLGDVWTDPIPQFILGNVGKIRSFRKSPDEKRGMYYDLIERIPLVFRTSNPYAPTLDEALQAVVNAGLLPENASMDDLVTALQGKGRGRVVQDMPDSYWDALQAEAEAKQRELEERTDKVIAADMQVGDTFTIDGKPHEVIAETDTALQIKGPEEDIYLPYEPDLNEEFRIDKGSLKRPFALEAATEKELATEAETRRQQAEIERRAGAPIAGTAGDLTGELFDTRESEMPLFAEAIRKPTEPAKMEAPVEEPVAEEAVPVLEEVAAKTVEGTPVYDADTSGQHLESIIESFEAEPDIEVDIPEGMHERRTITRASEDPEFRQAVKETRDAGTNLAENTPIAQKVAEATEQATQDAAGLLEEARETKDSYDRVAKLTGILNAKNVDETTKRQALELAAEDWTVAGTLLRFAREFKLLTPEGRSDLHLRVVKKWMRDRRISTDSPKIKALLNRAAELFAQAEAIEDADARAAAVQNVIDTIVAELPRKEKAKFFWRAYLYSNMLSSPKSHERNIVGNSIMTGILAPGRLIFAGQPVEAARFAITSVQNIGQAWQEFRNAMNSYDTSKLFEEVGETTLDEAVNKRLPAAVTFIGRFLEAQDKFFSTILKESAAQRLIKKGVTPEVAYQKAEEQAQKLLFRQELGETMTDTTENVINRFLDAFGYSLQKMRSMPYIGPFFAPFARFLRTPTKIAQEGVNTSFLPFIAGLPLTKNRIAKERYGQKFNNLTKEQQILVDDEIRLRTGQALFGTTVSFIGMMLAIAGRTTWAPPRDPEAKKAFYMGRKPYSIRIGDYDVPLWTFGPFALALAIPAAIRDKVADDPTYANASNVAKFAGAIKGLNRWYLTQTPFAALNGFINAIDMDDYSFARNFGFTAGQVIPASGLLRYVNEWIDRPYRNPETATQALVKDIPFLRELLGEYIPPYLTPEGKPAERTPLDILPPYSIGKLNPVYEELYQDRMTVLRDRRKNDKTVDEMIAKVMTREYDPMHVMAFIYAIPNKKEQSRLRQRLTRRADVKQVFDPYLEDTKRRKKTKRIQRLRKLRAQ